MTTQTMRYLLVATVVALIALPTTYSQAQAPTSDAVLMYDPAGDLVFAAGVDESFEGGASLWYVDVPDVANQNLPGYTAFLEPDGSISDYFGITEQDGVLYLAFGSDGEGVPAPDPTGFLFGPQVGAIQENGNALHDMTQYLDPGLAEQGFRLFFQSDGEYGSVPEPSTVVLLGLGSLMLAGLRRRQSK